MTFLQIDTENRTTDVCTAGKAVSNSQAGFFRIPVNSIRSCTLDERHEFLSIRTQNETLNLHSTGWKWETLMDCFCDTVQALTDYYGSSSDFEEKITVTEAGGITTLTNLYVEP